MSLFDLVNVNKTYRTGRRTVQALTDVNLSIAAGERLGIVGESGSGKSTLARMLVALGRPTTGEVWFDGTRIDERRESGLGELRSRVQFVFQDPRSSLNPRMRVRDIVTEPLRSPLLRRRPDVPHDHTAAFDEVMTAVDLDPELGERFPHEFSGGQRQRIAIARALVARPDVVVADEPVSALDVSIREQVIALLADLVARMNLTLVVVSHDLAVVRELCDRVAVLQQGRIVEQGTTAQVLGDPRHEYTMRLLAAIPSVPF